MLLGSTWPLYCCDMTTWLTTMCLEESESWKLILLPIMASIALKLSKTLIIYKNFQIEFISTCSSLRWQKCYKVNYSVLLCLLHWSIMVIELSGVQFGYWKPWCPRFHCGAGHIEFTRKKSNAHLKTSRLRGDTLWKKEKGLNVFEESSL